MKTFDAARASTVDTEPSENQDAEERLDEIVEAFRVGRAIGEHSIDPETLDALQRIQARLDEAERGENVKRAYANGYVDALSSLHAWTVECNPRRKTVLWRCYCNYVLERPLGANLPSELWRHPRRPTDLSSRPR